MAKEKDAKELVDLAADQAGHAAKNVGRAASEAVEELLPVIPMDKEGLAFALRVSNRTVASATAAFGVVVGVRVGKKVWALKKERDAKKKLEDLGAKPIRPIDEDGPETRGRKVG